MFFRVSSPFCEGKTPSIFNLNTYRELDISKNAWKNEHYTCCQLMLYPLGMLTKETTLENWKKTMPMKLIVD
jgi:hypothetical protein